MTEQSTSPLPDRSHGLQFAYHRTWRDQATDPSQPMAMSDLPPEVDLAFVFPDQTPPDNPFWRVLREEYVPALRSRGTRVVRTTDIAALLDRTVPDTAAGHRQLAEQLVTELVESADLDGLDIDVERHLAGEDASRAAGVIDELGQLLGPRSGSDRLLVIDTNLDGDEPFLQQAAPLADYLLVQSYGRPVSSLQGTWETFAPYLDAARYLIGFSFYEEFDLNRWDDTSEPFEDSRAAAFTRWQPEDARKAGVFSYAIDRDGAPFLDDRIIPTDFSWTRRLGALLRES